MSALFASPAWAWVALGTLVVLTLVFALDFTRRRRAFERYGHGPMLRRMTASLSPRRRVFRAILFTIGTTGVVVALAHPIGRGKTEWRQRGIDIALVLDYSKSMMASDVYPTRLDRVEIEIEDMSKELASDRVATVVFAGAAVHFPLTHDHRAARLLWSGITPADLPPGSDLGEAMRVARCLLRPDVLDGSCERVGGRGRGGDPLEPEPGVVEPPPEVEQPAVATSDRARAIVLFTDGEDTEGEARAEIEEAVRLGIDIYIVGVGTVAGELVPELDEMGRPDGYKKLDDGSFVTTRLDQAKLEELAALAGGEGHYFTLDSKTRNLSDLTKRLSRLKEGNLDERAIRTHEEKFQWILFPAFLLLLIEACMSERRRKVAA